VACAATLGLLELAGASSRAKKAKATPVIEETEV
jgi:outer membrane murein-binding lipoprotein Lpp